MIWFGVFEKIIKNWSEAPIVKDLVGGQKKLGKGNFWLPNVAGGRGTWLNISESS